jgi:oligopeptide transport system substrate-binding protein
MRTAAARLACAAFVLALTLGESQAAVTPVKTLRVTFQAAESGFDPVRVSDYYSGTIINAIFDPLLTYDYLARPAKLVPNVTEGLPEIADRGRTYTLKVKPGIYFTDDPAFKGKRRELTAADYAYAISTRRTAPRTPSSSKARSRASMRLPRAPRKASATTTMRRLRGWRRRTATRCASG